MGPNDNPVLVGETVGAAVGELVGRAVGAVGEAGGPGDDRPDHWSTPVPYHAPASGGPFMPDLGPPAAGRGAGGEEEGVAEASRRLLGQFEVV
eukprot:3973906-Pyramimonas_sp.AAC.1